MFLLVLILLILGAASFVAAAFGIGGRVSLGWLGLFFWILVPLCTLVNSHS
jgi:hypothetical protein